MRVLSMLMRWSLGHVILLRERGISTPLKFSSQLNLRHWVDSRALPQISSVHVLKVFNKLRKLGKLRNDNCQEVRELHVIDVVLVHS